jgi:hypothetical protein
VKGALCAGCAAPLVGTPVYAGAWFFASQAGSGTSPAREEMVSSVWRMAHMDHPRDKVPEDRPCA